MRMQQERAGERGSWAGTASGASTDAGHSQCAWGQSLQAVLLGCRATRSSIRRPSRHAARQRRQAAGGGMT